MIGKIPVVRGALVINDISSAEFARLFDDWKEVLEKTANDGVDGIMVIGGYEVEYIPFDNPSINWVSCKIQLPPMDELVLVFNGGYAFAKMSSPDMAGYSGPRWWYENEECLGNEPIDGAITHWAKLEAPKN